MAGIYLHIPFCKKACHYCDFHFTTSLKYKDELLEAMHLELDLQKQYLQREKISTIYFGGGTPSLVGPEEIQKLIDKIGGIAEISEGAEITMEANPDDLGPDNVKALKRTDINRLSIGIQSFYEEDLIWMNRAHNAAEAESSVKRAQDAGIENITADLIYGYPLLTDAKWNNNIQKMIELEIPHISAYSMTVEQKTALAHFIKNKTQPQMSDSQSAEQFVILMESLELGAYEHYEISNFAKPGWYSRHNSNYWKGVSYLGIGPSAHSYNGETRHWNIRNNAKYIQTIFQGKLPAEIERLSHEDKVNEYIMTSLRTSWGMDLNKIKEDFGSDFYSEVTKALDEFLEKQWIISNKEVVTLTKQGKLFADHIAAELFVNGEGH